MPVSNYVTADATPVKRRRNTHVNNKTKLLVIEMTNNQSEYNTHKVYAIHNVCLCVFVFNKYAQQRTL